MRQTNHRGKRLSSTPTPSYLSVPTFARWTMIDICIVESGIENGDLPAKFHRGQWWINVEELKRQLLAG